jgi:hypothetical protein
MVNPESSIPRRHKVAALVLAAAVGQAVLDDGGFAPTPRIVFALLSALALAAAATAERRRAWRAVRVPVVVVLWMLGVLGVFSAVWTVGLGGDAVRWGLVTLGYGAIVVSAAVLAGQPKGVALIAAGICGLAAACAIVGLIGAASFAGPFANYTRGSWRPGGTLEYSAALSLLTVSALPGVLSGMCGRSRALSAAAAACGTQCAAVLALADSRAELAFAGLVCTAAILLPTRTVRARRPVVLGAVGTLAAVGIGAHFVAGGHVTLHAAAHPPRPLVELVLLCLAPTAAWLLAREPLAHIPRASPRLRRIPAMIGVALAMLAAGLVGAAATSGDFWHGRIRTWRAAIETAEDRPLLGAGADSFLVASIVHQRSSPVRFAHDLPLELAVELGVAGLFLALALYVTAARALAPPSRARGLAARPSSSGVPCRQPDRLAMAPGWFGRRVGGRARWGDLAPGPAYR